MARCLIEALTGVGDINSDGLLIRASVPYRLSVWSDDEQVSGSGGPGGTVTIDGTITIGGIGEAVVLTGAEGLTLRLQDGRRLAFLLTSTGGHIVGQGGLQPA